MGRFDSLICDGEDFNTKKSDECPYKNNIELLLDDLLETDKLLDWHQSKEAQ